MDQRNPYGMPPPGSSRAPNSLGGLPQQPYMSDMMFDPMSMPMAPPAMYPPHPGNSAQAPPPPSMNHRSLPNQPPMYHQAMMPPPEEAGFVDDDFMRAFAPAPVMQTMYDQAPQHMMDPHVSAGMNMSMVAPQPASSQSGTRGVPTHMMSASSTMQNGNAMQMPVSARHGGAVVAPTSGMMGPTSLSSGYLNKPATNTNTNTTTATASSTNSDSRALTVTSSNNNSDDELSGLGDEDVNKKKERRRQQVRYASRRRRKKQKDEESFLRDRIEELKEQIRIIGGDLSEQCTQMAGMSEQALTEAYEKQMQTVQNLRRDNNKLKEQLLQHENFARMIQYGLNALPSDCRDADRKKTSTFPSFMNDQLAPLKGPTLVVDLNRCHEAVRVAYNELKSFGPSINSKTNVCFAMGWRTELWASGTCLSFKATRSITDRNMRDVTQASWEIITTPDKCKRIYPDVKQFRVLQKVNDDIVVVHRISSVCADMQDREFLSVAFRFIDGNNYFVGLKTIEVQTECPENCVRGEECQGWMFTGDQGENTPWKANFLGYYDVKGDKDDKVLNQLANETMFGMLRWESEAMHPLSV